MVKLPWTSTREAEARSWAQRSFGKSAPACASRVGKVLAECVTQDFARLPIDRPFTSCEGFNELRRVELFVALEREFGVSISEAEAETMTTPAAVVEFVCHHQPNGKNGKNGG